VIRVFLVGFLNPITVRQQLAQAGHVFLACIDRNVSRLLRALSAIVAGQWQSCVDPIRQIQRSSGSPAGARCADFAGFFGLGFNLGLDCCPARTTANPARIAKYLMFLVIFLRSFHASKSQNPKLEIPMPFHDRIILFG
jgi:hypothetical protein